MVISHYGLGMIKIQQGETVLVFNPIAEVPKDRPDLKTLKFGADIAVVSLNEPAYNGINNAARGDRVPFSITGPGEYEVGGVFIKGFETTGPADKINTAYSLVFEQLRLVHLGALTEPKLPDKLAEGVGTVDVLFIPVGNGALLTPKQASQVVADLEPEVVIPVDYDDKTLATFLKEMGADKEQSVDSLTIKKKDLLGGKTRVIVIKSY